jgi:nitrite reductase/ring-hydroxylating ferredoxin subunit
VTWFRVAASDALPEGRGLVANLGRTSLAIFRHLGQLHALDNDCPHQQGPLGMGWIEDGCAVCPLHYWRFDLRTGAMPMFAHIRVRVHPVEERADGIWVRLPDGPSAPSAPPAGGPA